MASFNDQANPGSFVPLSSIFDTQNIEALDVNRPEFKFFLATLQQRLNNIAIALNTKDSGIYYGQEFLNGQIYFPNPTLTSATDETPAPRQVFRTVVDFGALPNTGLKTVAHNIDITSGYSFTRIYGAATDPGTSFIPLPYAHPTSINNVAVEVDASDIIVTTGVNLTAYTTSYIVVEYIKE